MSIDAMKGTVYLIALGLADETLRIVSEGFEENIDSSVRMGNSTPSICVNSIPAT
jgi:hypothetical protein